MPLHQDQGRYTLKSSMRNQPNALALSADKRLDALVKKQALEHEHLLACHNKEMQSLRDTLNIAVEQFKSLSEKNDEELRDLRTYTMRQFGKVMEMLVRNDNCIAEQKEKTEALNKQLMLFHSLYFSKMDMDAFKKEVKIQINEVITGNINGYQECQSHLKSLLNFLRDDLTKSKEEIEKKFSTLIDQIERNYNVLKIDREGVLHEIRVWEKAIFIAEKKIENIYTLIERINQRGESCHKQE